MFDGWRSTVARQTRQHRFFVRFYSWSRAGDSRKSIPIVHSGHKLIEGVKNSRNEFSRLSSPWIFSISISSPHVLRLGTSLHSRGVRHRRNPTGGSGANFFLFRKCFLLTVPRPTALSRGYTEYKHIHSPTHVSCEYPVVHSTE